MKNKSLDQITADDLQELVTQAVSENREIEYKEKLPGELASEFLQDVSSFANASGGHLIYGMRDKRIDGKPSGIPEAIVGLGEINTGSVINSLENRIRNGIAPRMYVAAKDVACRIGPVIVFYIPRSYSAPHMVTLGGEDSFHTRSSAGKYKMNVGEIRNAFIASDTLGERLKAFRFGRVARVIAGSTPVPLESGGRVVLHVIPFSAESGIGRVAISAMESHMAKLPPMVGSGWDPLYNFDGFVTYSGARNSGVAASYVQMFRTGAVEAVDAWILRGRNGALTIPGKAFETRLVESSGRYLDVQRNLGLAPPFMIAITLLGVRGFVMAENYEGRYYQQPQPIDRDDLPLPEVVVDEYGLDLNKMLRRAFDTLWQSAGWARSPYSSEGDE